MFTNRELADRFGTPLYVYDTDRVAASHRDLRRSLPAGSVIFYSFKANPHPEIARAMRESGDTPCRAELCSAGELAAAIEAGFAPAECLYTGPGKTTAELTHAIDLGVRLFSIESPNDLRRTGAVASAAGVTVDCLLRINNVSAAGSTSIRMMGTRSQFGIDSETLPDLMADLTSVPGTRLAGVHLFSLSNSRDEQSLISELRQSIQSAARLHEDLGLPMRFLDLGGGFGAPYAVPGPRPRYDQLKAALEDALDEHFPAWRSGTPEVAFESGRYLAGDCGELITCVTNVKQSRGQTFAIIDAGINTLGGMAGLGRLMPVTAMPASAADTEDTEPVTLAGPLCTPGDLVARNIQLPVPEPGDLLTIPNIGAYGLTASLVLFLGRPACCEVVTRGGEVIAASQLELVRVPRLAGEFPAAAGRDHLMEVGVPR